MVLTGIRSTCGVFIFLYISEISLCIALFSLQRDKKIVKTFNGSLNIFYSFINFHKSEKANTLLQIYIKLSHFEQFLAFAAKMFIIL